MRKEEKKKMHFFLVIYFFLKLKGKVKLTETKCSIPNFVPLSAQSISLINCSKVVLPFVELVLVCLFFLFNASPLKCKFKSISYILREGKNAS